MLFGVANIIYRRKYLLDSGLDTPVVDESLSEKDGQGKLGANVTVRSAAVV